MGLKSYIPKPLRNLIHLFYAWWGAVKFGHPSEQMGIIGVTGTSGKSSTIYFLKRLLEAAGLRVGTLSTIEFAVAGETQLNDRKMTMLGKMEIQKYLREMVDAKCEVAIIETTSEGRLQHRHRFINYDMILLTNLYPEHIEAHGGFENYKQAKKDIFAYVAKCKRKNVRIANVANMRTKTAIVNGGSEFADEFLVFPFDKKIKVEPSDPISTSEGLSFSLENTTYEAPLQGSHNIQNLAISLTAALQLGVPETTLQKVAKHLIAPPGRIEFISEAEKHGFRVIVDYAFEPKAIMALYEVVEQLKPKRIIHVFGSTGGGRDIERRFTVGKFVGEHADICIITDEDPYDDDPQKIIDDVASAVEKTGKKLGETLLKILNRKESIQKAMSLATAGDFVLITGKGSEQRMVVKGKMIPWDDRDIVREALYHL